MWPNPQFPTDLLTFTEEILNGKLQFFCSDWCPAKIAFLKNCSVLYSFCVYILQFCWKMWADVTNILINGQLFCWISYERPAELFNFFFNFGVFGRSKTSDRIVNWYAWYSQIYILRTSRCLRQKLLDDVMNRALVFRLVCDWKAMKTKFFNRTS